MPPRPITLAKDEQLAIEGGLSVHVDSIVVEEIAASPDGTYPAGSGITLALVFAVKGVATPERRELSLLSAGYDSVREAWFDRHRFTVLAVEDPLGSARVRLVAERVTDRVRPGAPVVVKIARGGDVDLGPGARMTFVGHSHKNVEPGEQSPLMVAVEYMARGAPAERRERNVGSEDGPQRFEWRDYRFTILDYGYNDWMRLSIERLELEPVEPVVGGPG